ncbi:MAG: hypothetical protein HY248_02720 [Fimbriimonas ginsengisoli]|nr:hypothetical protein [Fimbriimonas ginsengisoli]
MLLAALVAGCRAGHIPNPNDPRDAGPLTIGLIQERLQDASRVLVRREANGEITPVQSKDYIAVRANELLPWLDPAPMKERDAWQYGDVYLAARRWADAKKAIELALRHPISPDRRVGDTLRLAHVQAELGKVDEALKTANSVVDVPDYLRPQILPAVLYDLAPAVQGKGHDAELAKLIERAIKAHETALVDPNTPGGRAYQLATPFHVRRARMKIAELTASAQAQAPRR